MNGTGIEMVNILSSIVIVRRGIIRLLSNLCIVDPPRRTSSSSSKNWHVWSWLNLTGGKLKSHASPIETNEMISPTTDNRQQIFQSII